MQPTNVPPRKHAGPNPGIVALVHTFLFLLSLFPVVSFGGAPHFPGPWESSDAIVGYVGSHATGLLICAFLQFGAAIPLGIFTATMTSRLQFLGIRAAGVHIGLFGGLMTTVNMAAAALVLRVMADPGVAQEPALLRALYYLAFSLGGVGFAVPMGLLIAGICIPAAVGKLLANWIIGFGLALSAIGELSALSLLFSQALFLVPLTRFPGFIWLIAAGLSLPKSKSDQTVRRRGE
jgi:hypothetical protein